MSSPAFFLKSGPLLRYMKPLLEFFGESETERCGHKEES